MKKNLRKYYQNKLYRWLMATVLLFLVGITILSITDKNKTTSSLTGNFMLEPTESAIKSTDSKIDEDTAYDISYEEEIENKLKSILSQVEGVGRLEVMITMDNKGEIILNKEYPSSKSYSTETDQEGYKKIIQDEESDTETVIINSSNGEQAIVVEEIYPRVRGVLIIAEGAGDINVKNNLFNAAKVLLNVSVNKIEVLEMNNIEESENE